MADFASSAATSTMSSTLKGAELFLELLKFLIARYEKKIEIDRLERKGKSPLEKNEGYINAKKLLKSGDPISASTMRLDEADYKKFQELAKKYGLLYSSVSPDEDLKNSKKGAGDIKRTILVREKDLPILKLVTDQFIEAKRIELLDQKINEIESKGEDQTAEDKELVQLLKKERAEILENGVKEYNDANDELILNTVLGKDDEKFSDFSEKLKPRSLSFDKSLNRFTARDYSRPTKYFICERTNPNRYMSLDCTLYQFNGKQHTETKYDIYRDGERQTCSMTADGVFSDKLFDGRGDDFWWKLREEMKEKGGFSDDVIIFNSEAEFVLYKQKFSEYVMQSNEVAETKNSDAEIEHLENQKKDLDPQNRVDQAKEKLIDEQIEIIEKTAESQILEEQKKYSEYDLSEKTKDSFQKAQEYVKKTEEEIKEIKVKTEISEEKGINVLDRVPEKTRSDYEAMIDRFEKENRLKDVEIKNKLEVFKKCRSHPAIFTDKEAKTIVNEMINSVKSIQVLREVQEVDISKMNLSDGEKREKFLDSLDEDTRKNFLEWEKSNKNNVPIQSAKEAVPVASKDLER